MVPLNFSPYSSTPPPDTSVEGLLGTRYTPDYREAFPDVKSPYLPLGYLCLLQLRMPKKKVGSIFVPDSEVDAERYRVQSTLVRSLGVSCFKDRQTGDPWVEGAWFAPGDFVRSPLFGGDRFTVDFKASDGKTDKVTFVFVKDSDVVALVTGDPLHVTTS